jgi:hypothetical protein
MTFNDSSHSFTLDSSFLFSESHIPWATWHQDIDLPICCRHEISEGSVLPQTPAQGLETIPTIGGPRLVGDVGKVSILREVEVETLDVKWKPRFPCDSVRSHFDSPAFSGKHLVGEWKFP